MFKKQTTFYISGRTWVFPTYFIWLLQDVAVDSMERMANSLQTIVYSSRTESNGQKYSTAEGTLDSGVIQELINNINNRP